MKKQPIELKPGLRIGVGAGRLILSNKRVDDDGLERWAVNYHLTVDAPIRDAFYLSAQVLRYIAQGETLERDLKSAKEYSRRMKIRKEELESQLATSERTRDAARRVNMARINKLESENKELDLKIKGQYNSLVKSIDAQKFDYQQLLGHSKHINSLLNSEKELTATLEKSLEYQRFWTFGLFGTSLMFFSLWIAAMYF
jgi:hypothetical protein